MATIRPFSLLIKPASADCNLCCPYCFYFDRNNLYPPPARMTVKTLEKLISSYLATPQSVYSFGWQGGEPTLMGLEFFKRVVELQQKHAPDGAVISNTLQTNGVLIDDEWARHLVEYRYLVGVSLDGPAEVHDAHRKNAAGQGSHARVMESIDCLKRNRVDFNVLTLVTQANVRKGREIYQYLREQGTAFQQYVPCVEFDEQGSLLPYAISGEEWGDFLCEVFDEWVRADTLRVSVRLFDAVLAKMVDNANSICHMSDNCGLYFVVEHNGDVYPCDFYVDSDMQLGNIKENDWVELQTSEKYRSFGKKKRNWSRDCANCEFLAYCMGDCPKHRNSSTSWLCEGLKKFFKHSLPTFERLATQIRAQRGPIADRNAPCPCGSGRKYKKCHGK